MLKELLMSSGIKDFIEQNVKSQQMTQQKWYYNITIVLIFQVFCGIGIKTYHHPTVEKN